MDEPDHRIEVRICPEPGAGDIELPRLMSDLAAGADLRAAVPAEFVLAPGARALIPCGFRMELPPGFEGQIRPRSGLALRQGLTVLNAPGTVDADYRGEVGVVLVNLGERPCSVKRGDRIAQLVISPVVRPRFVRVESLSPTCRGDGGFGHTGS